jgi:AcrR family transcriptional regulator
MATRIPAAERREVILGAAGPLFGRHGYAAARLDDIAAASGVTKPILYRHFESKKALYMALLERHEDDLPSFFEGIDRAATGESLVRAVLDVWLDYVSTHRHAWPMLFRDSSGDDEIRAQRLHVSRRARELLAAFIAAEGDLPADQVEPSAELLTSGLAGLALWWIDNPRVPKAVLVDAAARPALAIISRR